MNAPTEDRDLADARKVLAGDSRPFENIVRRWQGPLVNMAYRFCRDDRIAEELAQEAFLRAFRGLRRWRQEAAFSTWLFAIAANVYRSHLRRVRPREIPLDLHIEMLRSRDPAAALERESTAETVRRAVSTLPEKYRDALVLFYFHDMDVAAASTTLGVAEGTMKARLHRGRKLLRERLSELLPRAPKANPETI